jgi:hypothetical protein
MPRYHIVISYTYEADYEEDCPHNCNEDHTAIVKDIAETYSPISHRVITSAGLSHWNRTNYGIEVSDLV